jgi:transcriptional regulator with XRE-family HTH domain
MAAETQGERIRRLRDERGQKQLFIAKKAKVTQAHLSRIENDESGVTEHTLKKIAKAMGVTYQEIAVAPRWKPTDEDSGSIDEILGDQAAMLRFLGGEKPDTETYEWVKRSLEVIRTEIQQRLLKK